MADLPLSSFATPDGGKVFAITGGTQGLGLAVAKHLAERGAGGLVLVGRDEAKGEAVAASLTNDGCRAVFLGGDIQCAEAGERIVAVAEEEFGALHGVVNCAALTGRGSVWDTDAELWDEMYAVNLRAPALLISAAAASFKRNGIEGSIVLIGSVVATGGPAMLYPYSTTKGALHALTRNAAHALMRHRIRVNLVQPGWMNTPNEDAVQKRFHDAPDDWLEQAAATRPWGRLVEPDEVARAVCFLLSEESGMVTAAIFDVDQTVNGAGELDVPSLDPVWGES